MAYFSGITNSLFKKTEGGQSVFYPYGKLGSGYILSPDQEREARQFLNRTCMIYFVLILVAILFLGVVSIPLLLIGLAFYQLQLRRLVSNAEKTQEKMAISESYKNMAASMGKPTCMVLFALSLIMTILSTVGFIFRSKLIGSIGIVLFGFLTWYWFMMVRYSKNSTGNRNRLQE
jgi:hypothetical protein